MKDKDDNKSITCEYCGFPKSMHTQFGWDKHYKDKIYFGLHYWKNPVPKGDLVSEQH